MSADLDLGMNPPCGDVKEGVPLRDGLGGGCGPLKGPRLCQGSDPSRDLLLNFSQAPISVTSEGDTRSRGHLSGIRGIKSTA